MNAQVHDMIAEAERQRDEVSALMLEMDDDRFSRRPEPDRWSPGQQIAHLPLSDRPYLALIRTAQEGARAAERTSDGPFRGGRLGSWFGKSMEPPVKRRFKTLKKLGPPADLDREQVRSDFVACRDELIALLRDADGLDLDRIKMTSPFMRLLRMPLFSFYQVLLAHGRRHIWLAVRTAERP